MRIQLRKIRQTPSDFRIEKEGVVCSGSFWRSDRDSANIKGTVSGEIELTCDRCGQKFARRIEESFDLVAAQKPLKVDESLDVIECFDGFVDFDEVVESEIASIASQYHLCRRCGEEEHFEIEI